MSAFTEKISELALETVRRDLKAQSAQMPEARIRSLAQDLEARWAEGLWVLLGDNGIQ